MGGPGVAGMQDRVGWVSRGALEDACRRLSIPAAEAYGVVSFYARFSLTQPEPAVTHACDDISCMLAGAKAASGTHTSPCLGLCDRAPASLVERFGADYEATPLPEAPPHADGSMLLRRVAQLDPHNIESYPEHRGFLPPGLAAEIVPQGAIPRLRRG